MQGQACRDNNEGTTIQGQPCWDTYAGTTMKGQTWGDNHAGTTLQGQALCSNSDLFFGISFNSRCVIKTTNSYEVLNVVFCGGFQRKNIQKTRRPTH